MFTIYMKDGSRIDCEKVIGLQMLDYGVGSVTALLPGPGSTNLRRRIPVGNIKYIDQEQQENEKRQGQEETAA